MIFKKSIYGLKSSGAAFREHLAKTLYETDYNPRYADIDVWIRPEVNFSGF